MAVNSCAREDLLLRRLINRLDFSIIQNPTIGDNNLLPWRSRISAAGLYAPDDVPTTQDNAEHNVLAIEEGGAVGGNEELGSVRILSSVGHGQNTGSNVLQLKVFVWETSVDVGRSIDGPPRSLASLNHELRDDSVETRPLVAQVDVANFTSPPTETLKVGARFGDHVTV